MLTQAQCAEVGAAVCSKNEEVLSQLETSHKNKQKPSVIATKNDVRYCSGCLGETDGKLELVGLFSIHHFP